MPKLPEEAIVAAKLGIGPGFWIDDDARMRNALNAAAAAPAIRQQRDDELRERLFRLHRDADKLLKSELPGVRGESREHAVDALLKLVLDSIFEEADDATS